VPTWNYIAVHVYGRLQIMNEAEVMAWLNSLVDHHEADEAHPVSLSQMSPSTLRQVKGVVGFRIRIEQIQAAYKLSQGREEDHSRIIKELETKKEANSREIGKIMKERGSSEQ
jgi:transcriptional regulator